MDEIINTTTSEKKAEKAKRRRERDLNDIRAIVAMPEGRRFFWRVLSEAGVFKTSFTGQVESTMFNEGARNKGLLFLMDLLEAKPSVFEQMQRESASEAKVEKQEEEKEIKEENILEIGV